MKTVIALLSALALTGCATTGTVVPPSLLECTDQPLSPAGDTTATQADVGVWVIDMAEAGADCRSKLGAVRRLLTPETK
jgi:hypothetical protein